MVARAGAGPAPIPHKELTAAKLTEAIRYCLSDRAAVAAASIAEKMGPENGIQTAVESFHKQLPLERLQCDIIPGQPAVWAYSRGKSHVKLSKIAAETLLSGKSIESKHMKM